MHNLTRDHSTAGNKIKQENKEESGIIAWYNLRNFYKDDSKDHKANVLGKAIQVKRTNSLSELQIELDKWLSLIAKTVKYDFKIFDSKENKKGGR